MFRPGALEVYGEADWKLGSVEEILEAPLSFRDNQIQYNQKETGATDCTIYASMGAVSDLTGKVRTLEERQDMHDKAVAEGLDPATGRWLHKAVDLVRRESGLSSYNLTINSQQFRDMLYMGYSIITGYQGNRAYNEDQEDDCIIQNDSIGESTYGHAIRLTASGKDVYVVDNYLGVKKCNVYKHEVFRSMVEKGVFFTNGYIYLSKQEPMEHKLPPHMTPEQAPWLSDEIKAWENEMPKYLGKGGELAYNNYMLPANNLGDKDQHLKVLIKMMIDLNNARS